MRATRIKTGFHRLGLVLAAISMVIGAFISYDTGPQNVWPALIFAVGFYAAAYALGWIIAGFFGDGESG